MRRWFVCIVLFFSSSGCQAQLQRWQRERTVDHLSRLKSYQGHLTWKAGGDSSEMDIWFQSPNRFLIVSKTGEVLRSDGSSMDIYDPKTRLHSVFKNLPLITEFDGKELIRNLFDQNMKSFTFTLGSIGKIAGLSVIELRAKPKVESLVQSSESKIYDEFSFPLKAIVKFKGNQTAEYEFSKIAFNQDFELPKASIPEDALKILWDFKTGSSIDTLKTAPQSLKLEKVLKGELGATLSYYRNGAQYLSAIHYKNFGVQPKSGVALKVGAREGFLFPGPILNTLTVSSGDTTTVYSSNLLVDDLILAASTL